MTRIRNPRFLVAKQYQYREPFWGAVDQMLAIDPVDRVVVILDTGKALETQYLLQLGYRHIYPVNRSPGHAAWLQMLSYQHAGMVHPFRGELADLVDRISFRPIDVVNFDSMGTVGQQEFASTIVRCTSRLQPGAILGVTMMGSREVALKDFILRTHGRTLRGMSKKLPEYSRQDLNRLDYVVTLCNFAGRSVTTMAVGRYQSRHVPMLWAALQLGSGTQGFPKLL